MQKNKNAPIYRFFSTDIFKENDEVNFDAFSVGDVKIEVGENVLRDIAGFRRLARYWRSQKELRYRYWDGNWRGAGWSEFQPYIYVNGERIPVAHFGVEYGRTRIWLDFTNF